MIMALLYARNEDKPKLINKFGWRVLWEEFSKKNRRAFANYIGPDYWPKQEFEDKVEEIKLLAEGITDEIEQVAIVMISRTCSSSQVRDIQRRVGVLFDLTGRYDTEFREMMEE